MYQVPLVCHPASPSSVVRSIDVTVNADTPGTFELRYILAGAIGRMRLPAVRESQRADKLWEHTCFEMFAQAEPPAYREFNFSPSSEWAAYDFNACREGMAPAELEWQPRIAVRWSDYRLELSVVLPIETPPRLALAAVIEEENGRLSYWALHHPSVRPDFHHPNSFALES